MGLVQLLSVLYSCQYLIPVNYHIKELYRLYILTACGDAFPQIDGLEVMRS